MASTLHRFSRATLPVTPWKNGGGTTQEIACWPPGAGLDAFDWRVSIARIETSGAFSTFPGVERSIVLLDGGGGGGGDGEADGVWLRSADGRIDHRLAHPLEPFAFSGDAEVHAVLLGGATSDFNVMARRARGLAEVRVLARSDTLAPAPAGLVMCLRGHWSFDGQRFDPGEGAWWTAGAPAGALHAGSRDARLIAVRWLPKPPPPPSDSGGAGTTGSAVAAHRGNSMTQEQRP
ncbi:MAG: HutD family protein [Comamonadaceae bacterium]|nr:MAG: HutD family protein [Comamonadaceae bacterium]